MFKTALRWIASKITEGKLTSELLSHIYGAVKGAEARYPTRGSGAEKKAWVIEAVKNTWGEVEPFVIDTAVQLALGALRIGISAL